MFGLIGAKAAAAAPYVGKALVVSSKVVAGAVVSAKAGNYAQENAQELLERFNDVKSATAAVTPETDTKTPSTATKVA